MALTLAASTFTAGAKDSLATVDIYKSNAQEIISSIPISSKDIKDLFSSIKMSNGKLDAFGTIKGLTNTQIGDNLNALAKDLVGNARDLGAGVMGQATDMLSKTGIDAQSLSCTIGEYSNKVGIGDLGKMVALGTAVSGASGISGALGVASKAYSAGMLSGIVSEASSSGVAGVFTTLKDTITENGVLVKVAKSAMPFVLKNTDIRLLNEITSSGVGSMLNGIVPGFTQSLSQAYNPSVGYSLTKIDSFSSIISSFDSLDATWNTAKQSGGDIWSIAGILAGSKAFKSMIYTGVSYFIGRTTEAREKEKLQAMALAQIYKKTTVKELVNQYFPTLPLLGQYSTRVPQEETVDLRLVDRMSRILLS